MQALLRTLPCTEAVLHVAAPGQCPVPYQSGSAVRSMHAGSASLRLAGFSACRSCSCLSGYAACRGKLCHAWRFPCFSSHGANDDPEACRHAVCCSAHAARAGRLMLELSAGRAGVPFFLARWVCMHRLPAEAKFGGAPDCIGGTQARSTAGGAVIRQPRGGCADACTGAGVCRVINIWN